MITINKIYYYSFGCKVNLYETECIKENMQKNGFSPADNEADADLFIINSCTVTAESDKKLRKAIHKIKRDFPVKPIILTGCFAQAFPEEAKKLGADIIVGNRNKNDIYTLIKDYLNDAEHKYIIPDISTDTVFEPMRLDVLEKKTRAFVKIQDGCNQFCTYCIIPKARGRICSKPIDELKKEIRKLAENGYKEVVLVGINLSFYGKEYGLRLVDAVEAACSENGIERVRLGSLEPEVISDEDVKRMAAQSKLCPQFHLSLQSGCDKTLKAMNRHYTAKEYLEIVTKLRRAFDNCAITTDIMVGFPGETDDDFKESCEFAEKISFSQTHIFPYSRREGTAAYNMANQVDENVKNERAAAMLKIAKKSQSEYLKMQIGKVFPVLFEKEQTPEFHNGHTPNYIFIKVPKKSCEKSLRKEIFYVKIEKIENDCCIGQIIQ